jgi:hypothetical protein
MEDPMRQMTALCVIALLPFLACSGDSSSPGEPGAKEGSTPPVSAAKPGTAGSALEGVTDPSVPQCLDLVQADKYAEAVPVCTRAAKVDPDNAEVKKALETARAKAAEAGTEAVSGKLDKSKADLSSDIEAKKEGLRGQLNR